MALQTLHRAAHYAVMARDAARSRRAPNELVRQKAEGHLIQRMGKLRGLPQKLGQILSFGEETESRAAENPYRLLQENAQPLPLSDLTPVLEQAWNAPIEQHVESIDSQGKAGSLGQVHQATLHDGRQVAVKIQYPGIDQAVRTDLKMLGWLSRPVGSLRRGFNLSGYRQAILDDLKLELDYQREADSHVVLRRVFSNPAIVIPEVIEELSTDRVLVTDWLEGDHWDTVCKSWSTEEKQSLARLLLTSFLEGLFLGGAMQADWHPGNFRFRRDNSQAELVCYDLGSIVRPSDDERFALARLIQATRDCNESPLPLLLSLGFASEYLEPLAAKLPALCRVLFEPFCVDRPYNLSEWKLKERVADILGEDRWNFRIAGPPHLVFLLRAFHGLTYYLEGLNADLFWSRPFDDVVQQLSPQWQNLQLRTPEIDVPSFGSLAKHMKIRVTHNGKLKAAISTSASSIEHLGDLLDDELQNQIAQRGIDLNEVVAEARRRCYAPGTVFELEDGSKHVVVTLE